MNVNSSLWLVTLQALAQFTSGDFLDRLKSQKIKTVQGKDNTDGSDVKQEIKVSNFTVFNISDLL